jgi:hypothetical protein
MSGPQLDIRKTTLVLVATALVIALGFGLFQLVGGDDGSISDDPAPVVEILDEGGNAIIIEVEIATA